MKLHLLSVLATLSTVLALAEIHGDLLVLEPGNAQQFCNKLQEMIGRLPSLTQPHAAR